MHLFALLHMEFPHLTLIRTENKFLEYKISQKSTSARSWSAVCLLMVESVNIGVTKVFRLDGQGLCRFMGKIYDTL